MWRGVTRWKPFLSGASMIRVGWHHPAEAPDLSNSQQCGRRGAPARELGCDIETPQYKARDWNRRGKLEDFLPAMADWHFDWLDVPDFICGSDAILEYPMVDQDPLPRWSFGRLTLLGDAAHPMYPRGANGAAQAILDCRALSGRARPPLPIRSPRSRPMRRNVFRPPARWCWRIARRPLTQFCMKFTGAPATSHSRILMTSSAAKSSSHYRRLQARSRVMTRSG